MYVSTRTEVRTVTPLFIDNPLRKMVSFYRANQTGVVVTPRKVKVILLPSGLFSVKGIGKGGFYAVHLPGTTRIAFEGENSITLSEFWGIYGPGATPNFTVQES